jgi:hypothetical protein
MSSLKKLTGIVFLLILSLTSYSQYYVRDILLKSGDFHFLKNQTKIRVEYDWDTISIAKYHKKGDEIETEEQYIQRNLQERSKKPGSGKEWLDEWKGNRKKVYEPAFELGMNNKAEKNLPITFSSSYHDTQYTLILKTTYIEMGKYGYIYVTCIFVDSRDHSKIHAIVTIDRIYDTMPAKNITVRLEQSFYDAGNQLIWKITAINKEALKKKK